MNHHIRNTASTMPTRVLCCIKDILAFKESPYSNKKIREALLDWKVDVTDYQGMDLLIIEN